MAPVFRAPVTLTARFRRLSARLLARLPASLLFVALACVRARGPGGASATSEPLRVSCAQLGPAACDRPPSSAAALCASLTGCVKDERGNFNLDGMTLDCKREPFGSAPETAFTPLEPAPESSGVRATSIVNVVASENGAMQLAAAYLVAELPSGLCIVDSVLPWGGSHAQTERSTRWESPPGAPPRLQVRAQRTTFTVLDQEELAHGESNVDSELCALRSYDASAGRFTRLSQGETDGKCPSAP